MDRKKVAENIRQELESYVLNNNIKSLVCGISGGIDSALCCVLAKPVCDKIGIPLIGRCLPIESDSEEMARALKIGELFCTFFKEVSLMSSYRTMRNWCGIPVNKENSGFSQKVRCGNVKSRLRMVYLYNLAHTHSGMVLDCGNLTETLLGFHTLHGDIGDFSMLHNLWKTEVYELGAYFQASFFEMEQKHKESDVIWQCNIATPTDGLGITRSDLDQIGAKTYEEVDEILKTWLTEEEDSFYYEDWLKYDSRIEDYDDFMEYRETLKDHLVVKRHLNTNYKRNNPYKISRDIIFKQ